MKTCSRCDQNKDYSEFYPDSYQIDGFKTFCIQCDNEQSRLYYRKVKQNLSESQKKKRKDNYDNWKRENYEKYLEMQKKYREARKIARNSQD